MKMPSAFLELLHEDGLTEINKGTKIRIFVAFFPELTQKVTRCMYIAADCCLQRERVTYVECVTAQHIYCTNCTYSNYTEAAATCSAAQQESVSFCLGSAVQPAV
jgi:hypothetical protein